MSKPEQLPSLGTKHNLPDHIRDIAGIRHEVVAWTTVDESYDIDKFMCRRIFGFFVVPCFWPHLLILWPCLLSAKTESTNAAKSQYWILDTCELKIVVTNHEQCCIAGCSSSGNIVKTIPLSNITDCGFDESGQGRFNRAVGDVPSIYVDTASSSNAGGHEAMGLALKNSKELIQAILNQRDKGNRTVMSEPEKSTKSTSERLKELQGLYDTGVLTSDEYEKKRQEIIAQL